MTTAPDSQALAAAFAHPDPSVRVRAAMAAGTQPSAETLDLLLTRCAIEPDFQVREMLTWALIRLPSALVVPRLVAELARPEPQARLQALHTLSKFRDESAWPAVAARLDDTDAAVRRTAWYAAVAVVPDAARDALAERLATELGRGSRDDRLSLSRALVGLGPETIAPVLAAAADHPEPEIRAHAALTRQLLEDPTLGYAAGLATARTEVAMGRTRSAKG